MAEKSEAPGLAAVLPEHDFGAESRRLGVAGDVIGDVVERVLQSRDLRLDAVGGEDGRGVDRGERLVVHAVAPGEVVDLARAVARVPLAAWHGKPSAAPLSHEMDFHDRSLREHAKAEGTIRPQRRGQYECGLAGDPASGKHDATERADM
jgi:hypothetical protein